MRLECESFVRVLLVQESEIFLIHLLIVFRAALRCQLVPMLAVFVDGGGNLLRIATSLHAELLIRIVVFDWRKVRLRALRGLLLQSSRTICLSQMPLLYLVEAKLGLVVTLGNDLGSWLAGRSLELRWLTGRESSLVLPVGRVPVGRPHLSCRVRCSVPLEVWLVSESSKCRIW